MSARRSRRSERVYRRLLRAYPRAFRARWEEDVVEAFRDRCREAEARSGAPGLLLVWLRTVPDVMWHGLWERWSEARGRGSAPLGARAAWRSIRRAPALSLTVVITLGVGIGANVGLFSVLKGVLLEPLPYPDAERLVRLWEANASLELARQGPSPLNFADWTRADVGLEWSAAWYVTSGTYRTEGWTEELRSAQVTADFFRVLGVDPMLGRGFVPEEVTGYGPVVLSHGAWLRLFGGDPAVVGRRVESSGETYEIVGVMPADFTFPDPSVETWVAWDLDAVYADRPETRSWRFLEGVARLAPGVSLEEAERRLARVAADLATAYPLLDGGWDTEITSLHEETVGPVRGTLWLAFGSVLFILLIACANVANLLLARVPARSRELAIRSTLGASGGHLARALVAESLLLAGGAALLGLALGAGLVELLVALDAGRIPRLAEVDLDGGVVAFTALLALVTSLVFGTAPAVQTLRATPREALGDGVRTTSTRAQGRTRDAFVAAQVAVGLVLLTGAALFGRSLYEVSRVDLGIEPERVATFRVSLDPPAGGAPETVAFYDGLLRRVAEVPGVVRVGAVQTLPLDPVGNDFQRPYRALGSPLEAAEAPTVQMRIVTPGYAEAVGMRSLAGAPLPGSAGLGEPLVALVNQTLAGRLWPEGGAVGERFEIDFREGWQPYTVVGVVADVRHYGARTEPRPEVFLSHRQVPYLAMSVVARTVGDPGASTEALRAAARAHAPSQPAHQLVTLAGLLAESTAEDRLLSVLLGLLATVALLLAGTGVYGVVAYSVGLRAGEIGVRMALGARPGRVLGAVLGRALAVSGAGALVGLGLVAALAGLVERLLFRVTAGDPLIAVAAVATLVALSGLAAWIPARRASAIAPSQALRAE